MTAQERITEWAALANEATEGPWRLALLDGVDHEDGSSGYRAGIYPGHNPGPPPILLTSCIDKRDALYIAASRTAVPAMAAALTAVLELHKPQGRCHNGEGSWSVTRDVWDADYDGDPEVFLVCGHCGAIEMHESTEAGSDHSYLDALWPCPTVAAVETALGATA